MQGLQYASFLQNKLTKDRFGLLLKMKEIKSMKNTE